MTFGKEKYVFEEKFSSAIKLGLGEMAPPGRSATFQS
jgi:hypothetical protein